MSTVRLVVPTLTSRPVVRVVTARLRDLPGVVTVSADSRRATLTVEGEVTEADVRKVLDRSGHPAVEGQPC